MVLSLQAMCIKVVIRNILKDPDVALNKVLDRLDIPIVTKKIVREEVHKIWQSCGCRLRDCNYSYLQRDDRRRMHLMGRPETLTTISAYSVAKQVFKRPDMNLMKAILSLKLPLEIEEEVYLETKKKIWESEDKRFDGRLLYFGFESYSYYKYI